MSGISSLEILIPKPEAGDGICPPDKWTNNCNRAIVETLNEDFIAEFEDKIAGSRCREDALFCVYFETRSPWLVTGEG